jgi:hypothetical protein
MFGRRRPLARAAVIGGGAYALGKRRAEQESADAEQAYAEPEPAAAAAPAGGLSDAALEQLEQLGKLKEEGILTAEEFDQQKKKLLGA